MFEECEAGQGGWGPGRNWDGRGAGGEKERLESGIAKVAGTGRKCEKKISEHYVIFCSRNISYGRPREPVVREAGVSIPIGCFKNRFRGKNIARAPLLGVDF